VNINNVKSFYTIAVLILSSALLYQCTNEKKVKYDIPNHVTKANKELLIEKAEKGKVLYKVHCSGCHGIFAKGKDSIPNFTRVQIDNYHAAALLGIDARNHAAARKMSPEQVDQVMTFLRLRKIDNPIKDSTSMFRDSMMR
jgi:mono/diheme cytochrome c family protein